MKACEWGSNNRYACFLLFANKHVSHLMSFAFVFCEEDDGVGQRGGSRLHLLHHHLPGAVDGEDVTREILAVPSCCTAGGAGDWKEDGYTLQNVLYIFKSKNTKALLVSVMFVHLLGVGGPPVPLMFICQWLKAQQTTAYSPGSSITSQPTNFFTARLL